MRRRTSFSTSAGVPVNTTIYTLGYIGRKIEGVDAIRSRFGATLVDVRMVPRSRTRAWNSGFLRRYFGDHYIWLKEFGNRNYKSSVDQIEIVNFPAGEQRLRTIITTTGKPIILMCGCPDVNYCHRKLLAEWLAQTWNAPIEHLIRQESPDNDNQPTLF